MQIDELLNKNLCDKESNKFQWKEFMKKGVLIKNNWENLKVGNILKDQILIDDINNVKNEIYTSLKDFIPIPKLRKENLNLETEFNSPMQTYLFDFLYEQQELYDYYNDNFMMSSENNFQIYSRNSELPFSHSLENFQIIINEFKSESEKILFANLRWYLPYPANKDSEKNVLANKIFKLN